MNARRALSRVRIPDAQGAEERTWDTVRAAYQRDAPTARRRTFPRPVGVVAAAVVVAGAVALSPAGASVRRFVDRAFGVPRAARALTSLPAPGRLLVSGSDGTWIVGAGGSARRVGPWTQASWSPHGRYLAVTARDELAAVNTRGVLQWSLARRDVSDARWYSPTGYHMAYLSGNELRVVAGNGTADQLLARPVAHVAPAWRPDHPYELAYVTANGELMVRDSATGAKLWSANPHIRIRQLGWSANGARLLALSNATARLYAADGRPLVTRRAPGGATITAGALSPDGRQLALVTAGAGGAVTVYSQTGGRTLARRVLAGAKLGQVAWSPNAQWLLISWPAADQWVFVHMSGQPHIAAVSRISQQFSSPLIPSTYFPRVEGWCCEAPVTTRPAADRRPARAARTAAGTARAPAQPQALVTDEEQNRLLVVDLPSGRIARSVSVPADPEDIATSGNGGVVIVVSSSAGKVTILNRDTLRVIRTFGGFDQPHIAAVSPDGAYAYITDDSRGTLTVISLTDLKVTSTITVGAGAHHLAFSPTERTVWVALGENAQQITTLSTVRSRPPGSSPAIDAGHPHVIGHFTPGFPAHDLAFSPDGRSIWITSATGPDVTAFDARSHRVLFRVPVGAGPQHLTFEGPYAYVTSGYASVIEKVRATTGRVIARASAPYGSFELSAADGYVVTTSLLRGTLAIYTPGLKLLRVVRLAPATREVAISRP